MKHNVMKPINFLLLPLTLCLASCKFENFDERSAREAREYTQKQCPRRMDPATVLDSMVYDIPSRTLRYCYTMENELDDATELILNPEIRSLFREELLKALTSSIDLKHQKEHGVAFEYRYYSKKNKNLLMVERIEAEEYKTK